MKNQTAIYILKKIGQLALTILVLSILVFLVSRLAPGDPLRAYYGESVEKMSVQQLDHARERLGLNDSLPVQYIRWAADALHGDFGISYIYKQPAAQVVADVYQNTLLLAGVSFLLIFVLGLLLAIFCVRHEGRAVDRMICKIGVAANSIPEFFVALILILLFSVTLGILPQSGAHALGGGETLHHLVLPVSAIVISHLWYCAYLMRNKLSDEVRKEYILLCKVKGLTQNQIIYRHCLRNIMPAVVSIMAIFLPHLLGGAYVVEMVFSYPGLGELGVESAQYHDYNMLMLISLITGAAVVLANMIAQVINEKLDPRIKYEEIREGQS
ncbi:ABC transporter permease [Hominibacterium faecale]|uniref:ABC transporter permease n=1 Tax=Hominibacterium faecale TaxID=2839743 RepID=UPI0022B29D35|nr:ABC transporter permease [Hominibacterium faecale]